MSLRIERREAHVPHREAVVSVGDDALGPAHPPHAHAAVLRGIGLGLGIGLGMRLGLGLGLGMRELLRAAESVLAAARERGAVDGARVAGHGDGAYGGRGGGGGVEARPEQCVAGEAHE